MHRADSPLPDAERTQQKQQKPKEPILQRSPGSPFSPLLYTEIRRDFSAVRFLLFPAHFIQKRTATPSAFFPALQSGLKYSAQTEFMPPVRLCSSVRRNSGSSFSSALPFFTPHENFARLPTIVFSFTCFTTVGFIVSTNTVTFGKRPAITEKIRLTSACIQPAGNVDDCRSRISLKSVADQTIK